MSFDRYATLYWEDVKDGEDIPAVTFPLDTVRLVVLAAACRDYDPQHFDVAYAQHLGIKAPNMNSACHGGIFSRMLTDWAGPTAKVRRLKFAIKEMSCPGDIICAVGKVKRKYVEEGLHKLDIELKMTNRTPHFSMLPVAYAVEGMATLILPSSAGEKAKK